jgi:sortase A
MRRRDVLVGFAATATLAACGKSSRSVSVEPVVTTPATTAAPTTTEATTSTTAAPTTTTTLAPEPTTTIAPTTTLAPEPVTTTVAANPAAAPTPAYNGPGLGRIEIPKIGVAMHMFEGIDMPVLDQGPGHWPGTAMPGENGNMVIAGHRVSHTRPFFRINELGEGDEVYFTTDQTRHRYVVTGTQIVTPDAIWITDATPNATATLFACHPPGQTTYRWVTRLAYA